MAWQINGVSLDYGPSYQDIIDSEKKTVVESRFPDYKLHNYYNSLKDYDDIKTISWDKATLSLKQKIVAIPLFTNIPFYDTISGKNYTIQILDRAISSGKTYKNGEILWNISLKIRVI